MTKYRLALDVWSSIVYDVWWFFMHKKCVHCSSADLLPCNDQVTCLTIDKYIKIEEVTKKNA